jgi:hypothetical protein
MLLLFWAAGIHELGRKRVVTKFATSKPSFTHLLTYYLIHSKLFSPCLGLGGVKIQLFYSFIVLTAKPNQNGSDQLTFNVKLANTFLEPNFRCVNFSAVLVKGGNLLLWYLCGCKQLVYLVLCRWGSLRLRVRRGRYGHRGGSAAITHKLHLLHSIT